ncbi:hypothetical protein Ccrd_016735 [Cynara cardunculus var. scolymus]|uniref:ACT domain-containing protein ACR n=1 Tax=Cynara cardunculus var. scolymus TaxID=59895 RepID=A0A118K2U9_CYNCS|nr:hypothetical protein Ccrd_016735 [Cynara cardunculus var. scolymus]
MGRMRMSSEDVVLVEESKNSGDPTVVAVNCPDKAGLGCDLLRVVLEFGLYVTRGESMLKCKMHMNLIKLMLKHCEIAKGCLIVMFLLLDFSTDGKWCYIVLWVVARPISLKIDWQSFKNRLVSCCPSCLPAFYLDQLSGSSKSPPLYLLKVFSFDRKGLIHGECCISCELELAGPEYECQQGSSSIPEAIAEKLFSPAMDDRPQALNYASEATVIVDNLLSPAHSLLQIRCRDQKGLIYDILRISKDCDIQIAYGRVTSSVNGYRSLDLFIQNEEGKKIVNSEKQVGLCLRLKEEMLHPLRVMISNRGPDTELLVANPVELSGKGRPRVVYDVTFALKTLDICIFSAEIVRHSTLDREWEVYRFLLVENGGFAVSSKGGKQDVVDEVRRRLMGW